MRRLIAQKGASGYAFIASLGSRSGFTASLTLHRNARFSGNLGDMVLQLNGKPVPERPPNPLPTQQITGVKQQLV